MSADEQKIKRYNTNTVRLENTGIQYHKDLFPMVLRYLAYFEKSKKKDFPEVPDIIAFGPAGSGKSTLTTSLAKKLTDNNYREFIDVEQIDEALTDQDKALVLHESNIDSKYKTNSEKAKLHQGGNLSGGRILYKFLTIKAGTLRFFNIKELNDHLGPEPDLQTLRRVLILPIVPKLNINWDDPEKEPFILPDELKKSIENTHYQFDLEFIKFNCWAIATYCKNVKLPEEARAFLPKELWKATLPPLERDIPS